MTAIERERRRVIGGLMLLSGIGWMMLLVAPGGDVGLAYCRGTGAEWSWPFFRALLTVSPFGSWAVDWMLMLMAMMAPTLIAPVFHVHQRSFKHRRARSIALFAIGYGAIWSIAGVFLLTAKLIVNALAWPSLWTVAAASLLALVWQCSPLKQMCLNRSHHHSELSAFGLAADRDAFRFGLTHGVWCVASCWALMLLPMLLTHGHTAAMIAVTILMVGERLEGPRPLRWRLAGPGKLTRILVAQLRLMRSPSSVPMFR